MVHPQLVRGFSICTHLINLFSGVLIAFFNEFVLLRVLRRKISPLRHAFL